VGTAKGRIRRIAIVAVARKLSARILFDGVSGDFDHGY
jgi:hypothetical protein